MIASNVQIDPKLREAHNLSQAKKRELRVKIFLDYVKSQPAGTPIPYSTITSLLNFNGTGSAAGFVKILEKSGRITVNHESFTNSYTVNDARTVKAIKAAAVEVAPAPIEITPATLPAEIKAQPSETARTVRQMALEFYWESGSDNLRQFVDWLESDRFRV